MSRDRKERKATKPRFPRGKRAGRAAPRTSGHGLNPATLDKLHAVFPAIMEWYGRFGRRYPWRSAVGLYEALVAEKLLQQTKADQAAPAFLTIIGRWPDPCSLSKASREELEEVLRPLGFHRFRARELIAIALALCQGEATERELIKLPGVGEYIATAASIHALGMRALALDTNLKRLLSRILKGEDRMASTELKTLKEGLQRVLRGYDCRRLNYALLDFSAMVCRHSRPLCESCPISGRCEYFRRSAKR